jgi:mono/diheme cytochrome c family protein
MIITPTVRNALLAAAAIAVAACHRGIPVGASAAPKAAMAAAPAMPAGVTAPMIAEGDSIFNVASCQRCHGQKAAGGDKAPTLVKTSWLHSDGSYPAIVRTIDTGVPKADVKDPRFQAGTGMGPQASRFTPAQINALAAYIWSLNHAH